MSDNNKSEKFFKKGKVNFPEEFPSEDMPSIARVQHGLASGTTETLPILPNTKTQAKGRFKTASDKFPAELSLVDLESPPVQEKIDMLALQHKPVDESRRSPLPKKGKKIGKLKTSADNFPEELPLEDMKSPPDISQEMMEKLAMKHKWVNESHRSPLPKKGQKVGQLKTSADNFPEELPLEDMKSPPDMSQEMMEKLAMKHKWVNESHRSPLPKKGQKMGQLKTSADNFPEELMESSPDMSMVKTTDKLVGRKLPGQALGAKTPVSASVSTLAATDVGKDTKGRRRQANRSGKQNLAEFYPPTRAGIYPVSPQTDDTSNVVLTLSPAVSNTVFPGAYRISGNRHIDDDDNDGDNDDDYESIAEEMATNADSEIHLERFNDNALQQEEQLQHVQLVDCNRMQSFKTHTGYSGCITSWSKRTIAVVAIIIVVVIAVVVSIVVSSTSPKPLPTTLLTPLDIACQFIREPNVTSCQLRTRFESSVSPGSSIPFEIGRLTQLTVLDLTSSALIGSIPSSIASLTQLKWLTLKQNQLTGRIPTSIASMTQLEGLDFSSNSLSGSIFSSMANLTQLRYLSLSSNELIGSIPSSLSRLTNLSSLNLFENALTGRIPSSVASLNQLEVLHLSSNALTGIIPSFIATLTKLTYLNLYSNKLTGSIPSSLGSLIQLTWCSLSRNTLTGRIPSSLASLTKLTSLYLYNNELNGSIPSSMASLTKLTLLYLYSNELTGSIPDSLCFIRLLSVDCPQASICTCCVDDQLKPCF